MGILKKIAGAVEDVVSPSRKRIKRRLNVYARPTHRRLITPHKRRRRAH